MNSNSKIVFVLLLALCHVGCVARWNLEPPPSSSPLVPIESNHKQVELEIVFLRMQGDDLPDTEAIWREIDEQRIDTDVRRQLDRNGYRVGVVGDELPESLARFFSKSAQAADAEASESGRAPMVNRYQLYLRPGQPAEIVTSPNRDRLHVLMHDGQLRGTTFEHAQTVLSISSRIEPDGRVKLDVLPEIRYGQPQQEYVAGEGMFRLASRRKAHPLEGLRVSTTLGSGDILIFGSRDDRSGSLGHQFFTEQESGRNLPKLLLLRVARGLPEGPFDATAPAAR